ncbi:hypothetical protein SEEHN653_08959, partial [Salmonella enterica subsp. enterica serovar Heidelberg str. N653]
WEEAMQRIAAKMLEIKKKTVLCSVWR